MMKPNQVIDEITKVIYPPAEAVVSQLTTIRAIVTPTIKMYESTGDIHTIQPNLDMIERALMYLRGAPYMDIPLDKEPEDKLKPTITISEGMEEEITLTADNNYQVILTNMSAVPEIRHEELFGEVPFDAIEITIDIPVECGKTYVVTQYNPVLEHYKDDPDIAQDFNGKWYKLKGYTMEDDELSYSFLIPAGRNEVDIYISSDKEEIGAFRFTSHVHFKKDEEDG